jgi:hypothetical protein
VIEVADVLQLFAETSGQQLFRAKRTVAAIRQDRERRQIVDVIAGDDDFWSAVAVEIAHEHDPVRRRGVPHRRADAGPTGAGVRQRMGREEHDDYENQQPFHRSEVYGLEAHVPMTLR